MKLLKKYKALKQDLIFVSNALASGNAIVNCGVTMNVFEMALLESNIQQKINVIEGIEVSD